MPSVPRSALTEPGTTCVFTAIPPIAAALDVASSASHYVMLVSAGAALLGMLYLMIKKREFLTRAVLFFVRKLTRSR